MPQRTGGETLARSFLKEGVEVVFGLPGVQIMDVYDALYDLPEMRVVTVRNEQASTYMAYGYARTTGKIPVALVVPGPGALNATSGLLTAYSVSTPVLLVSGQVESENLGKGRGALHEVQEQLDVFRPITKWCHRVTRVEEIPSAIHRAFKEMRDGRPRPTELEIPCDVLSARTEVELLEREQPKREKPEPAPVRTAAKMLVEAHHPLIWCGGGAIASEVWHELVELAETLGAPVITTPEGKGVIPENHPLSLGVYYEGYGPAHWAIPKADIILAVGTRLFFPVKPPWAFQQRQKLIQVDVDSQEIGRNWPVQVGIASDAKLALRAILAELGEKKPSGWSAAELSAIKESTYLLYSKHAKLQLEIVQSLRGELADDAIVVAGMTNVAYWANLNFTTLKPRSWVTTSYAAAVGYELPTAIGASIGNPDRQVVALCGDGGFMYSIGELATAVQEGTTFTAIVFNDNAFGASLHDQQTRFQGRVIGTKLRNPDFAALAQTFGARGIKLDSYMELGEAVRDTLRHKGPTVIEVPMPTLPPPFQLTPTPA